jgi:hypothetical protein
MIHKQVARDAKRLVFQLEARAKEVEEEPNHLRV